MGLPVTHEAFLWLHNRVALPLMRRTEDLGRAYQHFGEANTIHFRVHKLQSSEAIYNQACCLSLGAAATNSVAGGGGSFQDPSQGLPSAAKPSASAAEVAEARLDLSAATLDAAVEAGYTDTGNMANDPDVAELRARRPEHFALAQRRASGRQAEARAAAGRVQDLGGSLPTLSARGPQKPNASMALPPGAAQPRPKR